MNWDAFFSEEFHLMMEKTVFLIPNWKWVGLGIALAIGLLFQPLLKQAFKWFKKSKLVYSRSTGLFRYTMDLPIHGASAWIITLALWLTAVDSLKLGGNLEKYLKTMLQLGIAFCVIRLIYYLVDAFGRKLADLAAKTETTLDDQLAPMVTKTLKFLVVILGILTILQNFGVNVVSVLAGLGLGGLALALAAQDTAANLFGSITILLDSPFKVGDHVKVGAFEGIIEDIGFRSTRVRTTHRSLVTIPNAVMAKEYVDNLGARNARRVRHIVGLTYDTPKDKMTSFIDQVRVYLKNHPKVLQSGLDEPVVQFNSMGDFNLQILVQFFIPFGTLAEELEVQQDVLFEIMNIANQLEVEFAFPTQTTHYKMEKLETKP